VKLPYVVQIPLFAAALHGCAAALVPETGDPRTKLIQAREMRRVTRPIAEEKLIREAIELSQQQNDLVRLGEAQHMYAEFLRSPGFNNQFFSEQRVKLAGGAGIETEARRYLQQAEKSYSSAEPVMQAKGDLFAQSNLWWRLSTVYWALGEMARTCEAMSKSLDLHQNGQQLDPSRKVQLPSGYKSYGDWIASNRTRAGCR